MGHLVILAQFACINTFFSCPCGRPNLLEPNETEPYGDLARPVVFKRLLSVMLIHVLVLVAFFGLFYHFANPACLSILDRRLHPAQPTAASTSSSSTRAAEFRVPENSASSSSLLATSPLPLFIGRGVDIPLPEDAGLDDNRTVSPTASPRSIPTEGDTDEEQGELARSLESHFRHIDKSTPASFAPASATVQTARFEGNPQKIQKKSWKQRQQLAAKSRAAPNTHRDRWA